jgi:hypothetical protein
MSISVNIRDLTLQEGGRQMKSLRYSRVDCSRSLKLQLRYRIG